MEINSMTLNVAKYFCWVKFSYEGLLTSLSNDIKNVIRIGVHGMGGVCKTTLAKLCITKTIAASRVAAS